MNRVSKPRTRARRGLLPWWCGAAVGVALAGVALVGGPTAVAAPDESGSTHTTYVVRVVEVTGDEKKTERFTMEVFELPAEKKQRQIVFVAYTDPEEDPVSGLPIGGVQLRKNNKINPSICHPMKRSPMDAILTLVQSRTTVPAARLESAGTGTGAIDLRDVRLDKRIPVQYETKLVGEPAEGEAQKVEYRVSLGEDPVVGDFGSMRVEVHEVKQRMLFAGVGGRILEGSWDYRTETTFNGRMKTINSRLVEMKETSHRVMPRAEGVGVWDEYQDLLPLARAVLPGHVADVKKSDIEDILADYERDYPKGLLQPAVAPLQVALDEKLVAMSKPLDPDERAKELMGKKAPDFTLKDLEGNEITMSKLKGRVVLVSFWAWA